MRNRLKACGVAFALACCTATAQNVVQEQATVRQTTLDEKVTEDYNSLTNDSLQALLMKWEGRYYADRLQDKHHMNRLRSLSSLILLLNLITYIVYSRRLLKKNRELVSRIQKQESIEDRMEDVNKAIPIERLSAEEQLYRRLQELMEDRALFSNSKLRSEDLAERLETSIACLDNAIYTCAEGLDVSKYIERKRVRHARHIFESQPVKTPKEVAKLCGFTSYSGFQTAFKKQYDMTPKEFRRAIEG